jgi:hypothetical protein
MRLVVWSSLFVLIIMDGVGDAGHWHHHFYLYGKSTLGLCSLGLDVARRIEGPMDGLRAQA